MKLVKFQFKEFAKYWFDLSKITFGSLILKFFEPEAPKFDLRSVLTIICGLILASIFALLGLKIGGKVKKS